METENSQNVFSVSITHNSKIRELSDRNRVMETELSFVKQPFCYGSHHFWVMSYENWELSYRNCESKQPLSSYRLDEQCKLFCVVYFISTKPSFMRKKKKNKNKKPLRLREIFNGILIIVNEFIIAKLKKVEPYFSEQETQNLFLLLCCKYKHPGFIIPLYYASLSSL